VISRGPRSRPRSRSRPILTFVQAVLCFYCAILSARLNEQGWSHFMLGLGILSVAFFFDDLKRV
jgi:hypothetical protein